MQVEVDNRFGQHGERLGPAGDAHPASIDQHLQERLHGNVHVRRQIGDERNAQFEMFHRVLLLQHVVIEEYLAVVDLDVRNGKALGLGRGGRRSRPLLQQIGDIEVLLAQAHQLYVGTIDSQLPDYRRHPEERFPREFDQDMPDVEEAMRRIAAADVQFAEIEPETVRIKADVFDRNRAMDRGGEAADDDILRDHRDADKADKAEDGQDNQDGRAGAAEPS